MNKLALTFAAFALALPAAGNAAVFNVGDPNFVITSGNPFSSSITASFFNGFSTTTSFNDTFEFTIPQNGVGSGSISTSFSSSSENKLTISDVLINGVSYAGQLLTDTDGQSLTVGGIPIINGVLNTIQVIGSTQGSGVYSGTATFAAVPEPAMWAMMIAGFAVVGVSMRRRQSVRIAFS